MLDNIKNNFIYWYCGLLFTISGILFIIMSRDIEIVSKMQEKLTYDILLYLFGIIVLCIGMIYLSTPISKILARNRIIQKWYINYKQKQRFKK